MSYFKFLLRQRIFQLVFAANVLLNVGFVIWGRPAAHPATRQLSLADICGGKQWSAATRSTHSMPGPIAHLFFSTASPTGAPAGGLRPARTAPLVFFRPLRGSFARRLTFAQAFTVHGLTGSPRGPPPTPFASC